MRLMKLIRVKEPRDEGGFNTFYVDVIEISKTEYHIRAFKASEGKFSYEARHGVMKRFRHKLDSEGERRGPFLWLEQFDTETAVKAAFNRKCTVWKVAGVKLVVPRIQKIYH